ncbi:hypothetical protein ES703_102238 [subsurface metagenome]
MKEGAPVVCDIQDKIGGHKYFSCVEESMVVDLDSLCYEDGFFLIYTAGWIIRGPLAIFAQVGQLAIYNL